MTRAPRPPWASLSAHARRAAALVWATAWLAAVELGVRLRPITWVAGALGVRLATGDEPHAPVRPVALRARDLRRLGALHRVARRWPFADGPCLRHALVAGRVLRRYEPRLWVGVAPGGGDPVAGHAWLEVAGLGTIGRLDGFVPLTTDGEAPA